MRCHFLNLSEHHGARLKNASNGVTSIDFDVHRRLLYAFVHIKQKQRADETFCEMHALNGEVIEWKYSVFGHRYSLVRDSDFEFCTYIFTINFAGP